MVRHGLFQQPAKHDVLPKEVEMFMTVASSQCGLADKSAHIVTLHRVDDVLRPLSTDTSLPAGPQGDQRCIMPFDCCIDRHRIKDVTLNQIQVLMMSVQRGCIAQKCRHFLSLGKRLFDQMSAQ